MELQKLMLALALAAPLAACDGGEDPPLCSAAASSPTADTLIGARVDGRLVLMPTAGTYGGATHDTTEGWLAVYGQYMGPPPQQALGLTLYGFSGNGTYPVQLTSSPGSSRASYWCQDTDEQQYVAQGNPGDRVTVTNYDSLTGEISGTFAFHGVGQLNGETVEVVFGIFNANVVKQ